VNAFWAIAACLAFIILAGIQRRQPGRAITDVTVLVGVFGLIAVANIVLGRFFDTGDMAWTIAAIIAAVFALEAFYGLLAPQRQRQRDRKLRQLMQRRRRA